MNILYIASYQGEEVIAQRVMRRNRALGGSRKIELISRLLKKQGHDVVILSSGIPAERTGRSFPSFEATLPNGSGDGIRVLYTSGLDRKILNYPAAILSAKKILRSGKLPISFDILLIYNIDEFTWFVTQYYLRRIKKIPLVLEYEDSVNVASRGSRALRRVEWRSMENWLRPRLSGVLSVNANLARHMQNPNTYILRGIVDEELCRAGRTRKPALSGEAPYLALFCGSLIPKKGAHFIPKVAAQFKGRVRFIIAGEGPLLDELRAVSRGCGGDIDVVGYLDRHQLNHLLTTADILLNTHEDEPGGGILPFKLIEYLVAGGIVVSTKFGNLNDVAYKFCHVIKPDEHDLTKALEYILERPEDITIRAKAGQAWAISRYSEDAVLPELDRVLQRALSGPSSSAKVPGR